MPDEIVTVNPNDPDGRIIYIRGNDTVLRLDVVRAQLILVQLGKAITAAVTPSSDLKAGDPGRLSVRQRNYILAMCNEIRALADRKARLTYVSGLIGRSVDTLNDLTSPEASRVIDELQHRTRYSIDPEQFDPEGAF